jgi:hypothetical protein
VVLRIVVIWGLMWVLGSSGVVEAKYEVEFGIFGEVGEAKGKIERNATSYRIEVAAWPSGAAKRLTGERLERYMSEGKVVDGKLVPRRFVKWRHKGARVSKKEFVFDHGHRVVYATKSLYKNGKLLAAQRPTPLEYYAKEDLFTLYFNIFDYLPSLPAGIYRFYAVGGERRSGAVDIVIPDGDALAQMGEDLGEEGIYFGVIVHQPIFASKDGELLVVADGDGVAKRVLLKDVIMFGDIVGKLVKKRVNDR